MGNQGYSNEGARRVLRNHLERRYRRRQGSSCLDEPAGTILAAGTRRWCRKEDAGAVNARLGCLARRCPRCGRISPAYVPHNWRGFPDFGCGAIGDMACHIMGTPNMAMRLTAPDQCRVREAGGQQQIHVPAEVRDPLRLSCARLDASGECLLARRAEQAAGDPRRAGGRAARRQAISTAVMFIGDKGMVTTGCYGERTRLVPDGKMKDYKLPAPVLTRSPGHYRDWIRACKGGEPACSNFSVAGPFVQWMLLGVIAMKFEGKLMWDAENAIHE